MERTFGNVFVLLLLCTFNGINGLPAGAPPDACSTMTPMHGNNTAQHQSTSPFVIQHLNTYFAGKVISVSVSSNDDSRNFKGILLQARRVGEGIEDATSAIVGTWILNNDTVYQLTGCLNTNDTLTHRIRGNGKPSIFLWMAPPNLTDNIQIFVTIVEDFSTFWVKLSTGFVVQRNQVPIQTPCSSSPCQNGGSCVEDGELFTCTCTSEYEGATCNTSIEPCNVEPCGTSGTCLRLSDMLYICQCDDGSVGTTCVPVVMEPCIPNPCANEGMCLTAGDDQSDAFVCVCTTDFTGATCEIDSATDPCRSSPCVNGVCQAESNSLFSCMCPAEFTGTLCDTVITACTPIPCGENGYCFATMTMTGFFCVCSIGYDGDLCETVANPCHPQPCFNGGSCIPGTDPLEYNCTCLPGFIGIHCNEDPCQRDPCLNGATCVRGGSDLGFVCMCTESFMGTYCSEPVLSENPCIPSPCANGGTCLPDIDDSYTCVCLQYFIGPNCSHVYVPDPCLSDPCLNAATCFNQLTSYYCACSGGYSGVRCEFPPEPCSSNPCRNSGTCQTFGDVYTCNCSTTITPGFTGEHCEIVPDPCLSNPCLNAATCYNRLTSYDCSCSGGYSGVRCEFPPNACDSTICLNGGICNNGLCDCSNTGYAGMNCELLVDACFSGPCKNGATCDNLGTYYLCICPADFEGTVCERRKDPCGSAPCLNGASCTDLQGGQYACNCLALYTGVHCETEVNVCSSSPCQSGSTCHNTPAGYMCVCRPGYGGVNCENVIQACISNPCLNGGTCINQPGASFMCICTTEWTGLSCDDNVDLCASAPCQNGGLCTNHYDVNRAFYQCQCAAGYFLLNCEEEINECYSNPCLNGGACEDRLSGFVCNCIEGFNGSYCEINVDSCISSPCENGICNDLLVGYTCGCFAGYTGDRCEINIPECESDPCRNGGVCVDRVNGFSCICPIGFGGITCGTPLDCFNIHYSLPVCGAVEIISPNYPDNYDSNEQCEWFLISQTESKLSVSVNYFNTEPEFDKLKIGNGQESDDVLSIISTLSGEVTRGSNYTSNVPGMWMSFTTDNQKTRRGFELIVTDLCILDLPCDSNPCQNEGTCQTIGDGSIFTCDCPIMFSGDLCQTRRVLTCDSNPCLNDATCVDSNFGQDYRCFCLPGYTGINCENETMVSCPTDYCLNDGTCSIQEGNVICTCLETFTGDRCTREICLENFCLNGGTCLVRGSNDYLCQCNVGYAGDRCEEVVQPCDSNPCFNDGNCVISTDGLAYTCECADGYGGFNCGNVLCPPGYCQNNGLCSVNGSSLLCFCSQRFTGNFCEIEKDPCAVTICLNGGTCSVRVEDFTAVCECSVGFAGTLCANEICPPQYCSNAVCLVTDNGQYHCVCNPGFTGDRCRTEITACTSSPCINNGTCVIGLNNTFSCYCPLLREGVICEDVVCPLNYCENGASCMAFQSVSGDEDMRFCDCQPGYTGDRCQDNFDDCQVEPCLNGGTCIDGVDTYYCNCPNGFSGEKCDIYCLNYTCENFGSCLYDNSTETIGCGCLPGYGGDRCEIDINECASSPCPADSICIEYLNGYQCKCIITDSTKIKDVRCINTQDPANSCLEKNICPQEANCVDFFDGYYCNCHVGLASNNAACGKFTKVPIDENPTDLPLNETVVDPNETIEVWWFVVIAMASVLLIVFVSIVTYAQCNRDDDNTVSK